MTDAEAPAKDKPAATGAKPEPKDDLVTTSHAISVDGRPLEYDVTAGRIVLRRESHTDGTFDGAVPKAEVFLTAYTLPDAAPGSRPVTFAFNGGPGSASVWLHLGVLGPRRVVMGDAGALLPPPYALADNPETLLATSDLVFIDPVSTGYSRPVTGEKPADFHGYQPDVESVAEIIRLWTTRNGRWMSPKFVAGESYGTTRACAVAHHLQQRMGMALNGIMLISSALDFQTFVFSEGNDLSYVLYLPTYAAIAHFHGLLGEQPLSDVLADAEEFAYGDYARALALGPRLPAAERDAVLDRLATLTGLSTDYLDRVDLRVEHERFFAELLRERRQVVGRLDGRFTGHARDYALEKIAEDPSMTAITGPYTAALNHYVRSELRYESDLAYEVLSLEVNEKWSFKEFEGAHVTVADKLSELMRSNPHLKVHVASGYLDGATPYFAADHAIAHLRIPDELRANIETVYYEAGHMMYVHEPSRLRQSDDLAAFVRNACGG